MITARYGWNLPHPLSPGCLRKTITGEGIYGILSLRIQSKMKGYGVSRGSRSFSNNNNNNNDIVALYAALILALIVVCSKAVRM